MASTSRQAPPDPRRRIPGVSAFLELEPVRHLAGLHTRAVVLEALRTVLEECRAALALGGPVPSEAEIVERTRARLEDAERQRLRPVVNATGVVLHTGLGRAVLPQAAVAALASLNGCCNLQIDLDTGLRGKRNCMTEALLCRLTGAEAALVVTNNAAATFLVLSALCSGREVVVSRGQLIEIGGAFRLPDCIHQAGAALVEVGTTNKTHLRDYENALTERTAALFRCNPSNYRIVGFTKSVSTAELVGLKARQPLLVIDDLGCGALVDLARFGLPTEPTVQDSIAAGADLALFSGDKLIGGPQAGIIVGRAEWIARLKKHPLVRMLRVGKMTDLALEHTLRLFLDPESLTKTNPTLRMLSLPPAVLRRRAAALGRKAAAANPALRLRVIPGAGVLGGGALPATPLPGWLLAVACPGVSAEELNRRLRRHEPPVIARIENGEVLLDLRTILDGEVRVVLDALAAAAPRSA